ncbi:hypothetical protein AAHE18_11G059900 [Arachis hypogaea]
MWVTLFLSQVIFSPKFCFLSSSCDGGLSLSKSSIHCHVGCPWNYWKSLV